MAAAGNVLTLTAPSAFPQPSTVGTRPLYLSAATAAAAAVVTVVVAAAAAAAAAAAVSLVEVVFSSFCHTSAIGIHEHDQPEHGETGTELRGKGADRIAGCEFPASLLRMDRRESSQKRGIRNRPVLRMNQTGLSSRRQISEDGERTNGTGHGKSFFRANRRPFRLSGQ